MNSEYVYMYAIIAWRNRYQHKDMKWYYWRLQMPRNGLVKSRWQEPWITIYVLIRCIMELCINLLFAENDQTHVCLVFWRMMLRLTWIEYRFECIITLVTTKRERFCHCQPSFGLKYCLINPPSISSILVVLAVKYR